jgi:hypothetical protein
MATNPRSKQSIVPQFLADDTEWKRKVGAWILEANQGNLNNTAVVTLTANAGSTTVTERRAGEFSFIGFMPTTANAAAELGNGTLYVSAQGKQTFTITHANNAQADRTFTYCILG